MGLDTKTGLILVYLGGAMGMNTWLMKGFFDTIPSELDESARVDGATPAQIFWGVVLPLALPILAVVAIISFVGIFNEFVIAGTLLQSNDNFTLPRRPARLHRQAVRGALGAVRGGRAARGHPGHDHLHVAAAVHRRGLTQGSVKG